MCVEEEEEEEEGERQGREKSGLELRSCALLSQLSHTGILPLFQGAELRISLLPRRPGAPRSAPYLSAETLSAI